MVKILPVAVKRFSAVYENLQSDNPENWSNAVHSCRRILKDLANAIYPPAEDKKIEYVQGRYESKEMGSPKLVVTWTPPPDTTEPTFSNLGTNTTVSGENCKFYTEWMDNIALSGYIFGFNDSGIFENDV